MLKSIYIVTMDGNILYGEINDLMINQYKEKDGEYLLIKNKYHKNFIYCFYKKYYIGVVYDIIDKRLAIFLFLKFLLKYNFSQIESNISKFLENIETFYCGYEFLKESNFDIFRNEINRKEVIEAEYMVDIVEKLDVMLNDKGKVIKSYVQGEIFITPRNVPKNEIINLYFVCPKNIEIFSDLIHEIIRKKHVFKYKVGKNENVDVNYGLIKWVNDNYFGNITKKEIKKIINRNGLIKYNIVNPKIPISIIKTKYDTFVLQINDERITDLTVKFHIPKAIYGITIDTTRGHTELKEEELIWKHNNIKYTRANIILNWNVLEEANSYVRDMDIEILFKKNFINYGGAKLESIDCGGSKRSVWVNYSVSNGNYEVRRKLHNL